MFFLTLTSFISLNAQWAIIYGGSDFNFDWARSIQQTSDGGYIVAGSTESFGAGGIDFWVLKLTSTGEIEWQRTYGGIYWDETYSIQQTSDGGYIVAGFTLSFGAGDDDSWILKLNSAGAIEWQHTYGGSKDDKFRSIQQTSDGGYIVAGDTASFGYGAGDIWVLKLFSTGEIEWQHTYGGAFSDYAPSIQQTSDGGYIVAGSSESFGAIDSDFWVLKLDSNGAIEWQDTYGGSDNDYARSIQQTSDGGYIVAGDTASFGAVNNNFWILKVDSSGDIEWQRAYGGNSGDYAYSIQQTSDGGYIVAGYTLSFGVESSDFWILKLGSSGDIEWQHTYGGDFVDHAYSIQQTSDGGYIVAGETGSFGINYDDLFIIKLYSDGDIDSSCGLIGISDALAINTDVTLKNTFITPQVTYVTPSDTNCTVQDTSASIVVLCEAPKYSLKISASTGGTTDPAPSTYTHYNRTEVTVRAMAYGGYKFSGWSGDASGTSNPITVTMDSDKSVTANFTKEEEEKKGPCFIATAAYISPLHPYVKTLRDFRDTYLMPNKFGRMLVNLYYKYSPFMADFIAKHKALKVAVRIILLPMIAFSYSMLHFGPIITAVMLGFIFMLPIFLISFFRRKVRRMEAIAYALASLG